MDPQGMSVPQHASCGEGGLGSPGWHDLDKPAVEEEGVHPRACPLLGRPAVEEGYAAISAWLGWVCRRQTWKRVVQLPQSSFPGPNLSWEGQ